MAGWRQTVSRPPSSPPHRSHFLEHFITRNHFRSLFWNFQIFQIKFATHFYRFFFSPKSFFTNCGRTSPTHFFQLISQNSDIVASWRQWQYLIVVKIPIVISHVIFLAHFNTERIAWRAKAFLAHFGEGCLSFPRTSPFTEMGYKSHETNGHENFDGAIFLMRETIHDAKSHVHPMPQALAGANSCHQWHTEISSIP